MKKKLVFPLWPNPEVTFSWEAAKKVQKKIIYFLMDGHNPPLPPLNCTAIKKETFFATSLTNFQGNTDT